MCIGIYPGQYYDAETGLHYNWHRYYDPATGRYFTPDPIGLDGGINLWVYVNNNPINLVDFTGKQSVAVPGSPYIIPYWDTPEMRRARIEDVRRLRRWYENRRWNPASQPIPNYSDNKKRFKKDNQHPTLKCDGPSPPGGNEPEYPIKQIKECIMNCRKTFKCEPIWRQVCISGCILLGVYNP